MRDAAKYVHTINEHTNRKFFEKLLKENKKSNYALVWHSYPTIFAA